MTTITVVGQAPSRTSDPRRPFDGAGRGRLEDLLGVDLGSCLVVNLLSGWPGPSAAGKGDAFPMRRARRAARVVTLGDGGVVLAGGSVARAFGLSGALLEEGEVRGRPTLVVPHPSGVSMWWNDESQVALARRVARAWVRRVR